MEDDILQNSELRYRRLFEAARDGILILNEETGRIEDSERDLGGPVVPA